MTSTPRKTSIVLDEDVKNEKTGPNGSVILPENFTTHFESQDESWRDQTEKSCRHPRRHHARLLPADAHCSNG